MTCTHLTRIECAMDASVDSDTPKINFGDQVRLQMKDPENITYIKFDVHRPRWSTKTIIGTLMRIWVPLTFSSQTVTVKRITQKWREDTITWDKQPTVTASGASSDTVSAAANAFWEVEIDTIFADWVANKAPYGVQLTTDDTSMANMHSSEAREMFRPELLVTWSE